MEPDVVEPVGVEAGTEVMGAIEQGPVEQFIISDVTTDDTYLTVPLAEAASLPAWR